jgi:hypothetical protein
MGLIYLALYKGRGTLFNRLVRLWTRSIYSHCEIVMPDGRWLSASAMDGGVRAKRIDFNPEHWDLIPIPWADAQAIDALFAPEEGGGYDYLGLFGSQLLPVSVHAWWRWFCSELCAHLLGFLMPHRYSPGQLGEVVKLINRILQMQAAHGQRNEQDA